MAIHRHTALALLLASALAGCAQTTAQPVYERAQSQLPPPAVVVVFPFAIAASEVTANQGFLAQAAASLEGTSMSAEDQQTAHEVARGLANDLVAGIAGLGLPARLASQGGVAPGALIVSGAFVDVNEGNRAARLVIGFGAGQSRIDARMRVASATPQGEEVLARFELHADSGTMPGAAVTMGAGAAAQGTVTAGIAAANAGITGLKAYRSSIDPMLGRMGDQAIVSLSQYFASQGWIPPNRVKTLTWPDL